MKVASWVSLSAVSEDIDDNDERLDAADVVELTVDTAMDRMPLS